MISRIVTLRMLFVLACCGVSGPLRADWQKPTVNYTRNIYAAGSQTWMIRQHPNGWMYFGNNKGLLEFDGELWNTYSMGDEKVRAILIDRDSSIYVSGLRQFGFFTPNRSGGLDYRSLSDSLPERDQFNVVWNIHATDEHVYFQGGHEIICYHKADGSIQCIYEPRNIHHSVLIDNRLYVANDDGLAVLNGDRFHLLPGTQAIGNRSVVAILPVEGGGKLLIVTKRYGLFLYDGYALTRFRTVADTLLAHRLLLCAAIEEDLLVLGTVRNGVQLIDLKNGRTENISTQNGLQNNTVLSASFDRDGNLWLGLNNGIDFVRMNARSIDLYGGRPTIGSGYASCRFGNHIYYGTNQGLYRADPVIEPGTPTRMEQIEPIGGQIYSLDIFDDRLFCSGDSGLFVLSKEGVAEQIEGFHGVWSVVSMNRPDRLIAGSYSGLYLLVKEQGRWRLSHHLEGWALSCKNLFVESGSVLWASNKSDGLYRITLSDDLGTILHEKNYNDDRVPKNMGLSFTRIGNDVVVTTPKGIFRYNHIKDELEPFPELEERLLGRRYYRALRQLPNGDFWYAVDETLGHTRNGEHELFLPDALINGYEHYWMPDDDHVIVATEDGFTTLDLARDHREPQPPGVAIRQLYLGEQFDSLAYGRSYRYDTAPLRIPYAKNTLRFVCSSDNYASPQARRYSFRLNDGSDGPWTEFSENNTKEYTDLSEGNYTFEVRVPGHDADGQPVVASLAFRVLPPWYRTTGMYLLYLLAAAGVLLGFYLWIYARQRAIVRRQQDEMRLKELAFAEENRQQAEEIRHLEEEQMHTELRHKTEELAQSTLNIVRKNEMLLKIKREASNILKATREADVDIVHIRRGTMRLIDSIDRNLEHDNDLQKFEATFDTIHRNFFRHLEGCAPNLSKQEKMLCAYIRIGMMSKEIAPLMNISVRGVEISRYRLRKKLGLEEGASLTAFLQNM